MLWAAGMAYSQDIYSDETIPEIIRRPQQGEPLRYPQDVVIGSLGRGKASEEAYQHARNVLGALLDDNRTSSYLAGIDKGLLEDLAAIFPLKYRIGGGRGEPDGSTSFLFRFMGRDMEIAGELYLRQGDATWQVDDIIMEEGRELTLGGKTPNFDFPPYERVF
ncbi:hypothetical protein FACS189444_0470 [Spirochaetia bacterium]|nr:hypothetical protein FACS189444_0470 [Spirochaetia bacterium]